MPIAAGNPVNSENWHLLKASTERLETSVAAMREMLALTIPNHTKLALSRNIQEGEALIAQLREILAN